MNLLRRLPPMFRLLNRQHLIISTLFTGICCINNNRLKAHSLQINTPPQQYQAFTHETYTDAILTHNVIVILDPDRFQPHFSDELHQLLEQVQKFQDMKGGKRRLKILRLTGPITQAMKQEFSSKYHVDIEDDTLLLLKNKYIKSLYAFNASDYFENRMVLVNYFKKLNKITIKNMSQFKAILGYLPSKETAILLYAPKGAQHYSNLLTRFCILQQNELYSKNDKLHWLVIDDKAAEELQLKDPVEGGLYILQKASKFNNYKHSLELQHNKLLISTAGSMSGKKVENVMDQLSDAYNSINIFSAMSFGKQQTKYSLVLELDLNKVPKHEERRLIKIFSEFKEQLKVSDPQLYQQIEFINLNKTPRENQIGYQIYLRDDEKYGHKLRQHSEQSIENIKKLSVYDDFGQSHSYQYRLSEDFSVSKEALNAFVESVRNGTAAEYYSSQDVPKYRKYSQKLVGKTFKEEVMDYPNDYAIFQYSKNCHACGEYGQFYENLALEHLKKDSKVKYGRLNNDRNKPDSIQDYPYTPVFMVCKQGIKQKPYVYRNQKFTPALLRSFYDVTAQFELIPEDQYQQIQKAHQSVVKGVI